MITARRILLATGLILIAFGPRAHANVITDLKNFSCEVTVDGRVLEARLGEMGNAFFDDQTTGLNIMVSPLVGGSTFSTYISKKYSSLSLSTGFVSLRSPHPRVTLLGLSDCNQQVANSCFNLKFVCNNVK